MVFEKGSWRIRVPVKAAIAFASAGATDGTETSPTPVGDSVDSIRRISISPGPSASARSVAVEVRRDDLATLAKHYLAPGGGAQPEQEPAFHLCAD